ncbi:MAG: hypothetical protein QOK39_1109 [Acidimicrobiaceae bacterium]|jgi:hypothetical protein|nr:hypothetical protein [Acidimicrobiaceae bacterium]
MAADEPPDGDPVDDPDAELRLVESELAEARRDADELRNQIGDPAGEDSEAEDRANLIESLEMQRALIENLEARAAELRRRLSA